MPASSATQSPSRTAPRLRGLVAAAAALLVLQACSGESGTDDETPSGEPARVELTITEDDMPTGERVKVDAGEPVEIVIEADREGSLHVHSTPEQEIDFTEGTTTHELVIDQPGVVEVEMHDPDLVVLQLQVG